MTTTLWQDSFAVGNALIDRQHQQLFQAIHDLDHALHLPQVDTEQVFQCLVFLLDYTKTHFADEEQLMAECAYPDIEVHRTEHATLIRRLDELSHQISSYSAKDPLLGEALGEFLTGKWLQSHVIESDHLLIPYLARLGQT